MARRARNLQASHGENSSRDILRVAKTLSPAVLVLNLPFMRSLFALCLFATAGLVPLRAAEVEFLRVWPGWRDAESFERISEYFTGKEDTGREIVLRTHADQRAGFYYLVRVMNSAAAIPGAKFVLQTISPTNPEPKIATFAVELPSRATVFELGLTGTDWPDRKAHPVAWKLELRSADDHVLASAQSFLWEKPSK